VHRVSGEKKMVVVCTRHGATVELEKGFYTCIRCGSAMLTLLVTACGGRQILHMEPLVCPHCGTQKEKREADRVIARYCYDDC